MDPDCIFCKIAQGKVPCYKVWEDEKHLAFLDALPRVEGQTLVITKQHHSSDVFALNDETYHGLMSAAKKVAKGLENALQAYRVLLVFEGIEVPHVHAKLFPRTKTEQVIHEPLTEPKPYPGYYVFNEGAKLTAEEGKRVSSIIAKQFK